MFLHIVNPNSISTNDMNDQSNQMEHPLNRAGGRPQTDTALRGSQSPRTGSRVEQAFQMMGAWVNGAPEVDLYDFARMGN
jgi:hypothetical protein